MSISVAMGLVTFWTTSRGSFNPTPEVLSPVIGLDPSSSTTESKVSPPVVPWEWSPWWCSSPPSPWRVTILLTLCTTRNENIISRWSMYETPQKKLSGLWRSINCMFFCAASPLIFIAFIGAPTRRHLTIRNFPHFCLRLRMLRRFGLRSSRAGGPSLPGIGSHDRLQLRSNLIQTGRSTLFKMAGYGSYG